MRAIEQLELVRQGMLRLHKALLDGERVKYERVHGRLPSAGKFLQVAISDPSFEWLHRLSELIVQIDEAQEADEPLTEEGAKELMKQVAGLLSPEEGGQGFAGSYFNAIQEDPGVAMLHAEVAKLMGGGSGG